MAQFIPSLSHCRSRMTAGERRLAGRLKVLLDDDYLCWYDIPVGRNHRYPDFIILHPACGLLFLEVKDWRLENIKNITPDQVELLTNNGVITRPNPIEQARQCTYGVIDQLSKDPQLIEVEGRYQGNLKFPYGFGVVFTHINQKQLATALTPAGMMALPDHMVLCKDEMQASVNPATFQRQLWAMFNVSFESQLSEPDIERIRWHLFPEIRVQVQGELFNADDENDTELHIPEIIKVMDLQQEQLARNLGDGHRIIHGVAGSGKTMILGFRALQLAELMPEPKTETEPKPIVILCFNISLAARLKKYVAAKNIDHKVDVHHFHKWCGLQITTYHCEVPEGDTPYYERQVDAVISGVERKQIPSAQYRAVLIDEGHDFRPEWLQLITRMVGPETASLLLLYDDAQSIYRERNELDFSLASVGINARGRTTILRLNYRNTREILDFAHQFAKEFMAESISDDDHIPVIAPESAGGHGEAPVFRQFEHEDEALIYITKCVKKWLREGHPANEIGILAPTNKSAEKISAIFEQEQIPNLCLVGQSRYAYDPAAPLISILTIHSSKGLEFDTVIIAGIEKIQYVAEQLIDQVKLLYVGMTRAKQRLLITSCEETAFTQRIVDLVAP